MAERVLSSLQPLILILVHANVTPNIHKKRSSHSPIMMMRRLLLSTAALDLRLPSQCMSILTSALFCLQLRLGLGLGLAIVPILLSHEKHRAALVTLYPGLHSNAILILHCRRGRCDTIFARLERLRFDSASVREE
jgi:hypothetical protein